MRNILLLLVLSFILLISCNKEPIKGNAFITVNTHQGFVVPYALVNFYVASKTQKKGALDTTVKADKNGRAELARYHECFLDVIALKTSDDSTVTWSGSISLKIVPGETTAKTIVIQ